MNKSILIVDDEQQQAENLTKALSGILPDANIFCAFTEADIVDKVENSFFSLAIVDLRMDKFSIDGPKIIELIKESNPFSKVIVVSAFLGEFQQVLQKYLNEGIIAAISEKKSFDSWIPELHQTITNFYQAIEEDQDVLVASLLDEFANVKNEEDTYKKGVKFEKFISLLFGSMGFNKIQKRVKSGNSKEIDLIIRNDINDGFLSKFGKYFFIECKNKKKTALSKDDYIVFSDKIRTSAAMCDFGILCSTTTFPKTIYTEAIRCAKEDKKVFLLSSIEIESLITAKDRLDAFKDIIDAQVKDC